MSIMRWPTHLLLLTGLVLFIIPAYASTDYEKGAAAFQAKNYTLAENIFREGLRKNPKDANLHYGLADCLSKTGRMTDAKAEYKRCIALAPKSKLSDFAQAGIKYLEAANVPKPKPLPPLPAPITGHFGGYTPAQQFRPGLMPVNFQPGLPSFTVQTSSGNGYLPGFSSSTAGTSLPQPKLGTYGPAGPYSDMSSSAPFSVPRMHYHHHRGYSYFTASPGYGYQSTSNYNPYPFGASHIPTLEVKTYAPVPPPSVKADSEPIPDVELLAKQQKLVIDDEKSQTKP